MPILESLPRALLLLVTCAGAASAPVLASEVQLASEIVAVPIDHRTRHVEVEVEIDGRGPYVFQVDTYASIDACVDDDFARELGLRKVGTVQNSDGRNTRERDLVAIDQLQLGGASFTGLRALVDDYDWIRPEGEKKVQGLLGFELFRELLITFDYPQSRLVLKRGRLVADAAHTIPLDLSNGAPNLELAIDGEPLLFGIDTGSGSFFSMQLADAERFPLHGELRKTGRGRTVYSQFDIFAGALADPVDFAGHAITPAHASFSEGAARRLIGYGVLRAFAVTFDQRSRLMQLERPAQPEGVDLSEEALARWVGVYAADGSGYRIEAEGGQLVVRQEDGPPLATVALSEDELVLHLIPVHLRLAEGQDGRMSLRISEHPDLPERVFPRQTAD